MKILATGSKGNSILYQDFILIDCGVPFAVVKKHLKNIQIVFLSHRHFDHLNLRTLKKMQFERPTLRIGAGIHLLEHLKDFNNLDILELNKWYDYGRFKVSIGKLYHDVTNTFFRLDIDGYKIFHATDTAHLKGITAKDYDLYALEANYNEETVWDVIEEKERKGEYAYQRNSIKIHLSEQQAMKFFLENKKEESKLVRLHESSSYL